jgi:small-conductance mechanosensitive channel
MPPTGLLPLLERSVSAAAAALAGAIVAALLLVEIGFHLLRRVHGRWGQAVIEPITRHCWWPARATAVTLLAETLLPALGLPADVEPLVDHALTLLLIAAVSWLVVGVSFALEDVALVRFRMDVRDNLRARRVRTQVMILRRLTIVVVGSLALAVMLTTFPSARVLGASLLASAGVAGLVIGIAGRPIIGNLLAGTQILFSEPIRLDDVIVVQGQWGRVEEITFTYVVVHLWDDRRLVLPVSYFLENPFENWTRTAASLLATVTLDVDFMVPVQEVRDELERVLRRSTLWDGRTWNLQVTDVARGLVQVRALMSAADAPTAWDLRCEVREALVAYVRQRHPQSIPRTRVILAEPDGGER